MRDRKEAQAKAKALVAQMTVEERASQLRYDAPAIERLGVPAYNWWNEALHGVARAGTATMFPQPVAMASRCSTRTQCRRSATSSRPKRAPSTTKP